MAVHISDEDLLAELAALGEEVASLRNEGGDVEASNAPYVLRALERVLVLSQEAYGIGSPPVNGAARS